LQVCGECSALTRNNISRVHRVFVLDEAEAIHDLDLCNFGRAMRAEVIFDVLLGDWKKSINAKGGALKG